MKPFALLKHPSAFLPIAMSLAALATVLIYITLYGTEPQPDEGTAAHLWQMLMAAQMPIIAFFGFAHVLQSPRKGLPIMALQLGAAVAAAAPVFLLGF